MRLSDDEMRECWRQTKLRHNIYKVYSQTLVGTYWMFGSWLYVNYTIQDWLEEMDERWGDDD